MNEDGFNDLGDVIKSRRAACAPAPEGLHSRGYLPHYNQEGAYQMITYRLADSLPAHILRSAGGSPAKFSNNTLSPEDIKQAQITRRKKIEAYLDAGHGACLLKQIEIAKLVVDNWHFFDAQRYDLIAYMVMPNHVHVLIKTYKGWSLSKVLHGWKSYTAKEINKILGVNHIRAGEPPALLRTPALPIWQVEYWDRMIRNESHFNSAIDYIHNNPVKAGLCNLAEDWQWSSAGNVLRSAGGSPANK